MKIPWGTMVSVGVAMLNTVIPGVSMVETLARSIPALHGKAKQDAVAELVKQSLQTSERFLDKDLANDVDVDRATRGVIDAVVALNNILAQKAAASV